jgi:hypothetical protein
LLVKKHKLVTCWFIDWLCQWCETSHNCTMLYMCGLTDNNSGLYINFLCEIFKNGFELYLYTCVVFLWLIPCPIVIWLIYGSKECNKYVCVSGRACVRVCVLPLFTASRAAASDAVSHPALCLVPDLDRAILTEKA